MPPEETKCQKKTAQRAKPTACEGRDCSFLMISSSLSEQVSAPDLPESFCRLINDLEILYQIARTLQEGYELKKVFAKTLDQMARSLGLFHGNLRIMHRVSQKKIVEVSSGLGSGEALHLPTALLEKAINESMADNKSVIVGETIRCRGDSLSSPGEEDASFAGRGVSFLCVPVAHGGEVFGALSVARRQKGRETQEADLRLLTLIAGLIAQAVKLRQDSHEQIETLREENERLQHQLQQHFRPDNMIGNSRAMQTVYHSIEQVAVSPTTVLIRGESGVGKELVAHAIHQRSPREGRAFVKVNCAALPESIVESELFGHERGAFTGAIAMRKGRFELAHRGTIFLDEIGELPLPTQAKLLRVLQEKEFERVGGTETLQCDVRIIAATNRALEEFVESGAFRQDLYYRLNVFPIYVPALRERKTDILQLADFFIEKYNAANGKNIRRISTPAIDALMSYHWPGNVRELENCIERASLLAMDEVIHSHHLPPTLQIPRGPSDKERSTLSAAMDGFERELIIDALKGNKGNMAAAARQLGLTERTMGLRVKKYDLDTKLLRKQDSSWNV